MRELRSFLNSETHMFFQVPLDPWMAKLAKNDPDGAHYVKVVEPTELRVLKDLIDFKYDPALDNEYS